jgi:hypothetical protein
MDKPLLAASDAGLDKILPNSRFLRIPTGLQAHKQSLLGSVSVC